MVWSHPDISLEDVLNLIKGFVDILILASGYQSSGLPAVWDAQNTKKSVQWGIFFEHVFRRLSSSDDYQESMKELDAALLEMTSNPYFPQGLAHLSSATLSRARDFVLQHLLHALPLRDVHLSALLNAAVDMDLDDLRRREYNYLNVYLDKLMLQSTSLNLVTDTRGFVKDSMLSCSNVVSSSHNQTVCGSVCNPCGAEEGMDPESPLTVSNLKRNEHFSGDHSELIIQELLKRQTAVSFISSVETGLDSLSEIMTRSKWAESESYLSERQANCSTSSLNENQLVEFMAWNQWKSRNLSYLLDKKTVRLVSGANLIFSSPKVQWLQVFERLQVSTENRDSVLHDIIELSLLGCVASRWSYLIEHLMSVSYDLLTLSRQYHEVHNLLQGRSQFLHSKEERMNAKENGIIEYLIEMLGGQLHHLWKLSPILVAVAVPSWSPLFRLYFTEIEAQFKGNSSMIRCCSCFQGGKEHKECEIAERIWCLYIFHVRGSHLMNSISSA